MTSAQNQNPCFAASCGWKRKLGSAALFFMVALVLQWATGAYQSEFGSEPDEAAHYVTGLMVHDYVVSGFPGNPLHYAQDYYNHYPKVALGHWPPFFYVMQSAWTLVFGPSRVSVLVLMAVLTALVATLVCRFLEAEFGWLFAFAGALLFLAFPFVQQFSGAVMVEIPIALLVLLATRCFGRFLERERPRDALAFGALASLAILTKFSGFVLALLPLPALALARKFSLLKRAPFWWPAVVVPIVCGPWTLLTLKLATNGMVEDKFGWPFTHQAVPFYAKKFYLAVGAGVLVFAVIGFLAKAVPRRDGNTPPGRWAALGALWIGVLFLHMVVPCGYEARHLVAALPPVAIFAMAGADWIAGWLARRGLAAKAAQSLALAGLVAAFGLETFRIPTKGYAGFGPVAEAVLRKSDADNGPILIASDARGEGMFIAEMAMREKRPGHVILRASKELANSSWNGGAYTPKFTDAQSLMVFLQARNVHCLVSDTSFPPDLRKEHHTLLSRTVQDNLARFPLERQFSIERAGLWSTNTVQLYRFVAGPRPSG